MSAALDVLKRHTFAFQSEAELQEQISEVFTKNGVEHQREVILSEKDRIDFFCPPGIGIEVKLRAPRTEVLRQLLRYLEHESIKGLILVTSSHRLALGVPLVMCGKPVFRLVLRSF